MKIRSGFVSNSSSSSFVLSRNPGQITRVTIPVDISGQAINTVKELNEYCDGEFGEDWKEYANLVDKYNEMKAMLKAGKQLFACRVSNDDGDPVSNLIYTFGIGNIRLPKDIKLIIEH